MSKNDVSETDAAATENLLGEVLDVNPREEGIRVRLTARERAIIDRARGKIPLSDWVRQACLDTAQGEPSQPTTNARDFRKIEALILRLAERFIQSEAETKERELEILLAAYEATAEQASDPVRKHDVRRVAKSRLTEWQREAGLLDAHGQPTDPEDAAAATLKRIEDRLIGLEKRSTQQAADHRRSTRWNVGKSKG